MKHHFLQRNRLIAKLAGGVLVVEAGERSGSLNTAKWAEDYGVDVFAIPGPIGREASRGTNALLFDGAKFVTSPRDMLELLPWRLTQVVASPDTVPLPAGLSAAAERIFRALGPIGIPIDQIARSAECGTAEALALLAELELDGFVRQLAGKRFMRAELRTAG
jgi:DNA processing protein